MKATHVIISGYVQKVGFRRHIYKQALRLDIKGWIKNTKKGKVEALFCGTQDAIDELLTFCKKGPFLAEVKTINIKTIIIEDSYPTFRILETTE